MSGNNTLDFNFPSSKSLSENEKAKPLPFHQELFSAGEKGKQILLARAEAGPGGNGDGSGDNKKGTDKKDGDKKDASDKKVAEPKADGARGEEKRDVKPVSDRAAADNPKEDEPDNPFDHIGKAKEKGEALEALMKLGRKPTDIIAVRQPSRTDPNKTEMVEMTVQDRVKQLKQEIKQELDQAGKGVKAIKETKNPSFDEQLKDNREARDKLAKELGYDVKKLSPDFLLKEHQNAKGDAEKQKKIAALIDVVATREALTMMHYAPLAMAIIESEFRAKGYLNPDLKVGEPVPDSEFKRAMADLEKVKPGSAQENVLFGQGDEVKQAKGMYDLADKTVRFLYGAKQQDQASQVIAELVEAKKGDKEQHLNQALKLAEKLDISFLCQEAGNPENLEAGVSVELLNYIQAGSKARIDMAEYLESQGKIAEAQKLWTQAKTDNPEIIYAGFDKDGRPKYRKDDSGKTYEDLDRKITLGLSFNPGRFQLVQNYLMDNLEANKVGSSDVEGKQFLADLRAGKYKNENEIFDKLRVENRKGNGTAAECLKMMKVYREQIKKDVTEANKVVDQEVAKLQEQKDAYDKKAFERMTPDEKAQKVKLEDELKSADDKTKEGKQKDLDKLIRSKLTPDEDIERGRAERQIALHLVNKHERERYLARAEALTDMYEGCMHVSQGAAKSANELFRSAREKDPSLNEELAALKLKDPAKFADVKTLDDMIKLTDNTLDAYWQRNYKKIGLATAAALATLTGVGVIGLGSYLEMGIMTTTVLATGSGALVGGTANWAINRTVDPKAGWQEFRDGAKLGAMSAALVASPWAAQAYRAKTAADVANAAQASKVVGLAGKLGITRYTMAGAYAINGLAEAGNVAFDDKNVGEAIRDTIKFGTFDGLLLGLARKWGAKAPEAEAAASAAKASWARRLLLPAGLGYGMAAYPQLKDGKFDFKQLATEGTKNAVAFWLLRKYGLNDGKAVSGAPTMANVWNYAGRAYMMQTSWDIMIDRALKTYIHDVNKGAYYIKDRPASPLYGLVEDWIDYNFGNLDPNHPADLDEIKGRMNAIKQSMTGGLVIDHKEPDPRKTGARGLILDFSKQGKPKDK